MSVAILILVLIVVGAMAGYELWKDGVFRKWTDKL